jgi:UDP-glucose-4-epimerase GalE
VKVLVTGGAGYIGSHAVRALQAAGHEVTVLDDLSQGHRAAVPETARLVQGDLGDPSTLERALEGADAVMHFAALANVLESVAQPARYREVNVDKGLALLDAMAAHDIQRLVFSSTCAVYGEPVRLPIDEANPQRPVNPYGETKRAFEAELRQRARSGPLRAVALRYFNAAGAHPDGSLGEDHRPEHHLIPRAIDAALGRGIVLTIHGEDYDTADGTCIRDYIHVQDLSAAHVLALRGLEDGRESFRAYNLGTGRGHSVREVIRAVEHSVLRRVPTRIGPRRPGDPPALVASAERFEQELGFVPQYPELRTIVEDALRWRREHPDGYGAAA